MENENCRSRKRGTHDLEIPKTESQNVSLWFQNKAHKTDPMKHRATAGLPNLDPPKPIMGLNTS